MNCKFPNLFLFSNTNITYISIIFILLILMLMINSVILISIFVKYFFLSNISTTVQLPCVSRSVGRSVCHNFLVGREQVEDEMAMSLLLYFFNLTRKYSYFDT